MLSYINFIKENKYFDIRVKKHSKELIQEIQRKRDEEIANIEADFEGRIEKTIGAHKYELRDQMNRMIKRVRYEAAKEIKDIYDSTAHRIKLWKDGI
jgi:uncharacterized FlaG/YvyC family protein